MRSTPHSPRNDWLYPTAMGLALVLGLYAHVIPWLAQSSTSRSLAVQQTLFSEIRDYERLVSALDESTRAVMLSPERGELREKKTRVIGELKRQLQSLVEAAPSDGEIPSMVVDLADHLRKELVPQSQQVERFARAPGDWALTRFRTDYAEARSHHIERLERITNTSRALVENQFEQGQRRVLLSAGVLLLLWAFGVGVLAAQARLFPVVVPHEIAPHSVEVEVQKPEPHIDPHPQPEVATVDPTPILPIEIPKTAATAAPGEATREPVSSLVGTTAIEPKAAEPIAPTVHVLSEDKTETIAPPLAIAEIPSVEVPSEKPPEVIQVDSAQPEPSLVRPTTSVEPVTTVEQATPVAPTASVESPLKTVARDEPVPSAEVPPTTRTSGDPTQKPAEAGPLDLSF